MMIFSGICILFHVLKLFLLLLSPTELSCSLSNFYRSASFKNAVFYLIAHDKKMKAPSLWEGRLESDDECLSKCLLEPRCKSISVTDIPYQSIKCLLHGVDRSTQNQDLMVANGFRYYDAGYLQQKIGPVCRSKPNPCNGSMCVDTHPGSFKCNSYPGKSCKTIKAQFKHINLLSGVYDIIFQGKTYQIYCDMKTLAGGWQLIGKVDVKVKGDSDNILRTSITDILNPKQDNYIPTKAVLKDLKDHFGYSQLRFYCHKPSTNKRFHIRTTRNQNGRRVLKSFVGETNTSTPTACGSFERLEDDNSYLSRQCQRWNGENSWLLISLDQHPIYVPYRAHFGFFKDRDECDDFFVDEGFDFRGIWRFFAR